MRPELVGIQPERPLPVPWRDPHTVSPTELAEHIRMLERACEQNPQSADLRTCLGMAYAMNYDVYRSMDELEYAVEVDPGHFFAQLKLAELYYRLRALPRAEQEALKALDAAENAWQLSLARHLLHETRRLIREGTQKPEWSRPLASPAMLLMVVAVLLCLAVNWR